MEYKIVEFPAEKLTIGYHMAACIGREGINETLMECFNMTKEEVAEFIDEERTEKGLVFTSRMKPRIIDWGE
jgi:hypothetical protein